MKPRRSLCIFVAFAALSPLADAQDCLTPRPLSAEDRQAGWMLLSGAEAKALWTGRPDLPHSESAWRFEGECLHRAKSSKRGSLFSAHVYDDFDLEFEWQIAKTGNSGLKYLCVPDRVNPDLSQFLRQLGVRATAVLALLAALLWAIRGRRSILGRPWPRRFGYGIAVILGLGLVLAGVGAAWAYINFGRIPVGLEYQITDDLENSDAKLRPSHRTAALYDLFPATVVMAAAAGEFHRSRIRVFGNHVEHWYDGRMVLEYNLGSEELKNAIAGSKFAGLPEMARKQAGLLELQDHGDEVWFRYLRIRRLPRSLE